MPAAFDRRHNPPPDQAHGLRQMFDGQAQCWVPLVYNPHVAGVGAVMERLCAAWADQGLHTLVVDAAESASPPHELASVDLSACIEPLSDKVSYLAARGLPMDYLDSRATLIGFVEAVRVAAPRVDVVLLHASALDLRRMFVGRTPGPVLLAGNRADSLTHAYTSMKQLSQRLGALAYDLVVAADASPRRAGRMADRLQECADHFLGAALRHVALIDPNAPAHSLIGADLRRLAQGQVGPLIQRQTSAPRAPGAAARQGTPAQAPALPVTRVPNRRPVAAGRMN
jgi:flagellar biosynthesis protein FlhG